MRPVSHKAVPQGLRARNRESRNRQIIEAAAKLFRKRGYDQVKIEEIAAAAGVSVGTIYNYYKNKGDILVAIVSLEVNDVLAIGETIVSAPPQSPEKAVVKLLLGYVEHSLTYLDKDMWRQAMAITTVQSESPSGKTYAELDKQLENQTIRLLKGVLPATTKVDAEAIGRIIFNAMNNMFVGFVKDDPLPLATLRSDLRRTIGTLMALLGAQPGKKLP